MDYDAELRMYDEVLRRAWSLGAGDDVVDIGCGAGGTTREAARVAAGGFVLGVDVAAGAVAQARRRAREEGLRNVAFECADAQVYGFPDRRFDMAISRFGTMFFADPVEAFANIGRALRPGGRLVMMVWRAAEHNEWALAIDRILAAHDPAATTDPAAPDPFSLADPDAVTAILHAAGFVDVTVADVHRPVYYGADVDTALAWVLGFTSTKQALERMDPAAADDATSQLRGSMAEHLSGDGVWFPASASIVTARRRADG